MTPQNSTTVRSNNSPVWNVGRLALPALKAANEVEARAADIAAWISESLMFRTTRRARTDEERRTLAGARAFDVPSPFGALRTWRWGEGPLVLLVHGWNGRGGQLGALVAPLVEAGFGVVTFDGPGHGDSPGHRSSMVELAAAIEAVVDLVKPSDGPLHAVIAHSMGAPSSLVVAHRAAVADTRTLERGVRDAGLFKKLVFVAPPIDVRDFVRGFSSKVGLGPAVTDALRRRIETRFATKLEDLYAPALAQDLDAPLLVFHDRDDKEVPITCSRRLVAAWRPGAVRLEETSGLGHVRILRDPAVISEIVRFVRD